MPAVRIPIFRFLGVNICGIFMPQMLTSMENNTLIELLYILFSVSLGNLFESEEITELFTNYFIFHSLNLLVFQY